MNEACRSCGSPVRWVTTEGGKPMPIDPDPVPDGNIVPHYLHASDQVVAHVLGKDQVPDADQPRFVSHFVTCPNAAQHRRRRDG